MSSKKIKPYAIVPADLYVTRAADRQLRQIIEDMGRPGYVLVSRQMGKTNLLLNAKRELDSPESCFCYLDVSNIFCDLRSFFRNIIDTVLESKGALLGELSERIASLRDKSENLQPHKEHELELKEILNLLPGKLIICLDEIDALTKVDYADSVFSLIRSIYFSGRTNFKQFYKLTYVLSGVADPSELIKNKAISPFNIGEKIYLNDFTLEETTSFLEKCELPLNESAIERIYHWTAGNPRVTWDLCAAVEEDLVHQRTLSPDSIDSHVKRLYLTDFDLPPFDHIRTRVEIDREIRNAVIAIHYGKSASLSDKVKDKLYLAGVSTPKRADGSVEFKSRIMAESLSEKWLTDIEKDKFTIRERANYALKEKNYLDAIALFTEALGATEDPELEIETALHIGYCYVHLDRFDAAIEIFENCNVSDQANYNILDPKAHWSGICYLFSKEFDKAIAQFRQIVYPKDQNHASKLYLEGCVNLASAIMAQNSTNTTFDRELAAEVSTLLRTAIGEHETPAAKASPVATSEILYTANYQLGIHCRMLNDVDQSITYLEEALRLAPETAKTRIYLERAKVEQSSKRQAEIYMECADSLISSHSTLGRDGVLNPLHFGINSCAELALYFVRAEKGQEARDLLKYVNSSNPDRIGVAWAVCFKTFASYITSDEHRLTSRLARFCYEFSEHGPEEEIKNLLFLGMIIKSGDDINELVEIYVQDFLSQDDSAIIEIDFRIIYHIVFLAIQAEEYAQGSSWLELSDTAFQRSHASGLIPAARICCGAMVLLFVHRMLEAHSGRSWPTSDTLENYWPSILRLHSFDLHYFDAQYLQKIHSELRSRSEAGSLDQTQQNVKKVLRGFSKIGRNQVITVKYSDGRVESGKYKKYIDNLKKGECMIVDP